MEGKGGKERKEPKRIIFKICVIGVFPNFIQLLFICFCLL
jgi:hypothetical protein